MSYNRPRHGRASIGQKASRNARAAAAAGTVAAAAGGALLAGGAPAALAATPPAPLPVTLSADGDGTAAFSAQGAPQLAIGPAGTYAELAVNLKVLGDHLAPSAPPAFTTDNYAAGSPRWVIELANGSFIDGYPAQLGGGAKADFTGDQWAVGNSGTYETYAQALAGANDSLGNVKVTDAYIVEDADQAPGTVDTLTGVTYDGETLSTGGTVTVAAPGNQAATEGTAITGWAVKASADVSDTALAYSAANLPAGLSINPVTGEVSGTPASSGSFTSKVTATDAYGDTASAVFTYTVAAKAATLPAPVTVSHGKGVSLAPAREDVTWQQTAPSWVKMTITGPGAINGKVDEWQVTKAGPGVTVTGFVAGLEAGHTYAAVVTPTATKGGVPVGPSARIDFKTS